MKAEKIARILDKLDSWSLLELALMIGLDTDHYDSRDGQIAGIVVHMLKDVGLSEDERDFLNRPFCGFCLLD